jgi:hypothetical protein
MPCGNRFAASAFAFGRQLEVNGLAAAVDGSTQVNPAALDLHICLFHPPGAVAHAQVGADPLLQFGRLGLDPAEDGGVVHLYAAVQQRELEIALADREHQYHLTAHRITSAVKCRPLKD